MIKLKDKISTMKQSHVESCLASSLCTLLFFQKGIESSKNDEFDLYVDGSNYYRNDFTIGQLVLIAKKHNLKIEFIINYKPYANLLNKEKFLKNLIIKHAKIDESFIKKAVLTSPVIIYVDKFYLIHKNDKINRFHYPHFVILKKFDKKIVIIDPWDGKEKTLSKKRFMQAINDLQHRLWLSPRLIRII